MKVLCLSFISFLFLLQVYAVEYSDPSAVPESVLNDVLNLDSTPIVDYSDPSAVPESVLNDVLNLDSTPIGEIVVDLVFSEDINEYILYTSENPTEGQRLEYQDEESVKHSFFNATKITIFVVHGWTGHPNNPLNENVTAAVLSSNERGNYNIIRVGWSKYSQLNYVSSSAAVRKVGELLGKFIKFLVTLGLSFVKTIILGHSLGAHVAGYAGRECGSKLSRIIGTDPAGPGWKYDPGKLSKNDAVYVEVTHTSDGLGDYSLIGHADFYPNGGKHMESCSSLDLFCNHNMAHRYWCASWYIPEEYIAYHCNSMDEVKQNLCTGTAVHYGRYGLRTNQIPPGPVWFETEIEYEPFMEVE